MVYGPVFLRLSIIQEPKESPTNFLNCLKDEFRRFTDLDPDAPTNEVMLKITFIGQSAPDIRRKLQKFPAPTMQNFETLIQTAFTIFAQRDEEEDKKKDRKIRKQAALLAVALQPQLKGGCQAEPPRYPRIQCNQYAQCKKFGHWKNECPLGEQGKFPQNQSFQGRPNSSPNQGERQWHHPQAQPLMSVTTPEFYPETY